MNYWKCKFTLQGMNGFFEEVVQAMTSIDAQKIIEARYGHPVATWSFQICDKDGR